MAVMPVGSIVQVLVNLVNTDNQNRMLNRLRYVQLNTNVEEPTMQQLLESVAYLWKTNVPAVPGGHSIPNVYEHIMPSQYLLKDIRVSILSPTPSFYVDFPIGSEGEVVDTDFIPNRAACLLRYNSKAGRAGQGRMFVPIGEARDDGGTLDVNVDLTNFRLVLGAKIADAALGFDLYPCIVPSEPAGSYGTDVSLRMQTWSPYTSYLDTRTVARA